MSELSVLVVEDDETLGRSIARVLRRRGHHAEHVETGARGLERLREQPFHYVLLDLGLPDISGFAFLEALRDWTAPPVVFVLTGDDSLDTAVRAVRLGALEFITKPIALDRLVARLESAVDTATVRSRVHRRAKIRATRPIAEDPKMRAVLDTAARMAASPDASVFLVGESGVGKEVVASYIHDNSPRAERPFIRINVAALPESMVEAELFGSVRGAFTGANADRKGLMASADQGTLLLDELCELDVQLQPKLLRALEDGSFFPVGSDVPRSVDVRFIAATNVDPEKAIVDGRLRRDLFYRLGALLLRIPPLRERRADILPLARAFLAMASERVGCEGVPELPQDVVARLHEHSWPGNVRELRNVMQRAVILAGDRPSLELEDLGLNHAKAPESGRDEASDSMLPINLQAARSKVVAQMEREQIVRALKLTGGSQTEAAKLLGISRTTLWTKSKRYGLN